MAEGIFLRTWHSGPQKGQPKLRAPVQSMLARGLVEGFARPAKMLGDAALDAVLA